MQVTKAKELSFDPATATLWLDSAGTVCFLHRTSRDSGELIYQLTKLVDGTIKKVGTTKEFMVEGMCLCPCSVTIENE